MKFIFSFLLCYCLSSQAQFTYGLKGGLNLTQIHFSNTDYETSALYRPYAGFYLRHTINDKLSVQLDLLYANEGTREKSVSGSGKIKESYFHIPVLIQYHFIPQWYAEVGPQFSHLMSSKEVFGSFSGSIRQYYKKSDFRIPIGIGYHLDNKLSIGVRYGFSLKKINTAQVAGGNLKNQVLSVGFQYNLTQPSN